MSRQAIAAIVGVGPGIGSALAHKFSSQYTVALIGRTSSKLQAIESEIKKNGKNAFSVVADSTNESEVKKAFTQISEHGNVEVLIYNAAARPSKNAEGKSSSLILELSPEKVEADWKINCLGGLICAQQVLPKMVENQKGTILFTGATASLRASVGFANFAMGKFSLRALTQSMAREFGPKGIHVAHIIIDGIVNVGEMKPKSDYSFLQPNHIADAYWNIHSQAPSAWTQELDLRPFSEKF